MTTSLVEQDGVNTPDPAAAPGGLLEVPGVRVIGVPVVLAEVDVSELSSTRCVIAAAVRKELVMPVGVLTFDEAHRTVEIVYVDAPARRRGVAAALWAEASHLCPGLTHSDERSPSGTAWATAVGGTLPRLRAKISDVEGAGHGSRMMVGLHSLGLAPSDLLPTRR